MNQNYNIYKDSYWDKQTTGIYSSSGSPDSCGKTTAQMKTQSTFISWNFDTIWAIAAGKNNGYPYLRWQDLQSHIKNNLSDNKPCGFYCSISSQSMGNGFTSITVNIPYTNNVTLKIFNLSGRKISTLANKNLCTVTHEFQWDTRNIVPSNYIVRACIGSNTIVRSIPVYRQ